MKYSIVISVSKTKFGPVVFREDLLENIKKAYSFGYDAVELAVKDPGLVDIKEVGRLLQKFNLCIPAIGTGQIYFDEGISFSDEDNNIREQAVDKVCRIIDLAKSFNSAIIIGLIRGNVKSPEENFEKKLEDSEIRISKCLQKCMEYSRKCDTFFLLEPLIRYNSNIFNKIEDAVKFINKYKNKLDTERIGILADTYHMNVEEPVIEDSISSNINSIRYFHFSDSNRLAPGYGHINFESIMNILKKMKYDGVISFEIMPSPDSNTAAKSAIDFIKNL